VTELAATIFRPYAKASAQDPTLELLARIDSVIWGGRELVFDYHALYTAGATGPGTKNIGFFARFRRRNSIAAAVMARVFPALAT